MKPFFRAELAIRARLEFIAVFFSCFLREGSLWSHVTFLLL